MRQLRCVRLMMALTLLLVLVPSVVNAAPPAQEGETYTVQKDDSLWVIAEKYLGNGTAYHAIVAATNAKHDEDATFATISNASLIQPGWKLLVPGTEEAEKYIALAQPKRGGTMRFAIHATTTTLDPHKSPNQPSYWIDQLMYSYLVMFDLEFVPQPSLATEWEVSEDGLTWTFKLREGVKFHNGRELTAADVKYSIERILDPDTGSAIRQSLAEVESIETPDDYTVVLRLSRPNGVLLVALANQRAAIVAKEIVEEKGDLSQADAGSGPFKFVELKADGTVVLERHPDYWEEGLPILDRVELIPVPDTTARISALRAGDVDMIAFVTTSNISLLRKEPGVVVPDLPISGVFYFFSMNNKAKPFDDAKVRQAIAWALDRKAIAEASLSGEGPPLLAGPIPPWLWSAADPIYSEPDLEKAKQLLAESSVPDGFEFDMGIWSPNEPTVRSAEIMKEALAPLNIIVNIELQPDHASYWTPVVEGNYTSIIGGISGGTDPDAWLYERFHTEGGYNIAQYSNPEVDELLEQGRQESDLKKRKEIYDKVQLILATEAPMVFLYNMYQTEVWRDYVEGYYHRPTLTPLSLKYAWLDK